MNIKLDVGATAKVLWVTAKVDIIPSKYKNMPEAQADELIAQLARVGVVDGATPASGIKVFVRKRAI